MKFKALKLIIAVVALMLPLNAQAEKMGIADPARDKLQKLKPYPNKRPKCQLAHIELQ